MAAVNCLYSNVKEPSLHTYSDVSFEWDENQIWDNKIFSLVLFGIELFFPCSSLGISKISVKLLF